MSPDDHDITVNWKENANFLMFLMFLHFMEAATSICLLKKVFTTRRQKALDFFQWLWLLIIINFIIEQLFAEHRFLKNTYAWLHLTSKFYSEVMFCYHKIRMLQKGFSQLFFAAPWKLPPEKLPPRKFPPIKIAPYENNQLWKFFPLKIPPSENRPLEIYPQEN